MTGDTVPNQEELELYPAGHCPKHPKCKAWVLVKGKKICFECWNNDPRPTTEKEQDLGRKNVTVDFKAFEKQWEEAGKQVRLEVEFIANFHTKHPRIKFYQIHDSLNFELPEESQIFIDEFEEFYKKLKEEKSE